MGRAKLKMELIAKPKQRLLTFKKRKEGLMKKLQQLTTLCDVGACLVIFDPSQNQASVWPEQNPDQVRRLIDAFRSKDISSIRTYGVPDFFAERKKKVEEELLRLRRANSDAKFPSWLPAFDSMAESHLRALAASLLAKSQIVRSRIQAMRMRENQDLETMKNKMLLAQFYNLEQQLATDQMGGAAAGYMSSIVRVPQNYYTAAPPMPMPMPPQQPYVLLPANMHYYPTMDQNNPNNINYYSTPPVLDNINYWGGEDAEESTRYLLQ